MTGVVEGRARLLSDVPLFRELDERTLADLARRSHLRHLKAGEVAVRQGDRAATLYVVVRGRLKIETQPGAADPVLLDILGPTDIFGDLALLARSDRTANVIALAACELLGIDYRDLQALIVANPSVAMALLANLANRIIGFGESVRSFAAAGLEPRLARRLCLLIDHSQPEEEEIRLDLQLSQTDWARMAGVTREALNRQFRAWAALGWIRVEGNEILILDVGALRAVAEGAGLLPATPGQVT